MGEVTTEEAPEARPSIAEGGELARRRIVRGVVSAVVGGVCWGFSGTCSQFLMHGYQMPLNWLIPFRMLTAGALFLIVAIARDPSGLRALVRDVRSLVRIVSLGIFGMLLTQVSYLSCIQHTNSGTGTVLERIGLIFIMTVVCISSRRLPRIREVAGLLCALAGTALIATQGDFTQVRMSHIGLFWGIVSGFGLMFYTLIPGPALRKWGAFYVTGIAMLSGGLVAALATGFPARTPGFEFGSAAGLFALVVIGTFGAYLFYLQGVRDAGPVRASLAGCAEPISATVLSALWLGTSFSMWDLAGAALILVMMFLTLSAPATPADEAATAADAQTAGTGALEPIFSGPARKLGMLSLEPAETVDFQKIRTVIAQARAYLRKNGANPGVKPYPSARRLRRALDAGEVFVCRDGAGEIVGVFSLDWKGDPAYDEPVEGEWESESTSDNPHYVVLRWMSVADGARRAGVGAFMLDNALRLARESGCESVRFDVLPKSRGMRALAERMGFVECCELKVPSLMEGPRKRLGFELCV